MKKIFSILSIIILIIINYLLYIKIKIKSLNYKNHFLKGFLNKSTIQSMKNCFTLRDQDSIDCYTKNQTKIFSDLKKKFNTNYISVGHARWSDGSKNFDAQTYHRDIKPNIFKHRGKYPNIYTLVCFLDKSKHVQGNKEYILEPGDCLLFNSFNLHKGSNMLFNNKRRVIQFFHIFFDKREKNKFSKKHSNAEHYNNDFILKNINQYIDTRSGIELLNLVPLFLPMKLYEPKKNTYITLINKSKLIYKIDNVEYYEKF
jgi:hypothetical protein